MTYRYQSTDWPSFEQPPRYLLQPMSPFQIVLCGFLLLAGIYALVQHLDFYPLLTLQELLWNILVYAAPPSLVMALDKKKEDGYGSERTDLAHYSESRTFAAKSEALRRILHLDSPTGLVGLQPARKFSAVETLFKGNATGLPGLGNWDNSCYQNSVIQGLASLPSVSDFLDHADADGAPDTPSSTRAALSGIIHQLNDPENVGKRFWTPAALKSMSSWQQQDAQEYYSKVLDDIEKEITRNLKGQKKNGGLRMIPKAHDAERDPASKQLLMPTANYGFGEDFLRGDGPQNLLFNPLEGLLAQRVGCLQCGYVEGLSLVPFNCITLPLGRSFSSTVEDCLDDFTELESIDGVECGRCTLLRQEHNLKELLQKDQSPGLEKFFAEATERLKAVQQALFDDDFSENTLSKKCQIPGKQRVSSSKTKQAVIARGPESLVLHINRSVFDEMTGTLSKNVSQVGFPNVLDLSCWSLGGGTDATEEWNVDPHTSLLSQGTGETQDSRSLDPAQNYVLRAVITHYGRHENGHYICYRKDPMKSQQWWRLSDDDVDMVSEDEVIAQGGVFMLFYTRLHDKDVSAAAVPTDLLEKNALTSNLEQEVLQGNPIVQALKEDVASEHCDQHDSGNLGDPGRAVADVSSHPDVGMLSTSKSEGQEDCICHPKTNTDRAPSDTAGLLEGQQEFKEPGSGSDVLPSKPLLPTMRTSSANSNRSRRGSRPGMSGITNMVVAN